MTASMAAAKPLSRQPLKSGADTGTHVAQMAALHRRIHALDGTGLTMDLIDYVPCYRSLAGTGTAMGFAVWS